MVEPKWFVGFKLTAETQRFEEHMESSDPASDVPWLKEMVDEELHTLFSDDDDDIALAVRHFIGRIRSDSDVEEQLVDLIDTAIDYRNDVTSAAVWAVVVLGEAGTSRTFAVLQRSLVAADEQLQDAAMVALLRRGYPAIAAVMETAQEDENPLFNRRMYPLLGMIGVLDDDRLTTLVSEFLQERVEVERRADPADAALEEIVHAIARIGDRQQLDVLKDILQTEFNGHNPAIQDSIEMLEENEAGVAIGAVTPPWEERYGWILESDLTDAVVRRNQDGELSMDLAEEFGEETEEAVGEEVTDPRLLRGLYLSPREDFKPDEED